jgi:hypothetical protein
MTTANGENGQSGGQFARLSTQFVILAIADRCARAHTSQNIAYARNNQHRPPSPLKPMVRADYRGLPAIGSRRPLPRR